MTIARKDVELWWINGYGKQKLYPLKVTLKSENGDIHIVTKMIGFRTVVFV